MKKLIDILKEFDYGSELFADPSIVRNNNKPYFKNLISKEEPNTDDENKFLNALAKYTSNQKNPLSPSILKDLLKLKSKFPKILDPMTSSYADRYAYRGTQIDIDVLLKSDIKDHSVGYVIDNPNATFKSTKSRGYLSFSLYKNTATGFSKRTFNDKTEELVSLNKFPVVLEIYLNHPKLILSPDLINTVTDMRERETLLVSKVVKPRRIYVTADVPLMMYNLNPRTGRDYNNEKYSKYVDLRHKLTNYDDYVRGIRNSQFW